jgi:hypothetical protein
VQKPLRQASWRSEERWRHFDCDGHRLDTLGGEIGYFLALAPDVTNSTGCLGAFMAVHRVDIEANYAASDILLETDPIDRSIFLV